MAGKPRQKCETRPQVRECCFPPLIRRFTWTIGRKCKHRCCLDTSTLADTAVCKGFVNVLSCTGNLYLAVPWLWECCRQVEAEEVSNSRSKIHQTWDWPFWDPLYCSAIAESWYKAQENMKHCSGAQTAGSESVDIIPQSTLLDHIFCTCRRRLIRWGGCKICVLWAALHFAKTICYVALSQQSWVDTW